MHHVFCILWELLMYIWVAALEIMKSYFLLSYQIVQIRSSCKNIKALLSRGTFSHRSEVFAQNTLNTGTPVNTKPFLLPANKHATNHVPTNKWRTIPKHHKYLPLDHTMLFTKIDRKINPNKNPTKRGKEFVYTQGKRLKKFFLFFVLFFHLYDSSTGKFDLAKNKKQFLLMVLLLPRVPPVHTCLQPSHKRHPQIVYWSTYHPQLTKICLNIFEM